MAAVAPFETFAALERKVGWGGQRSSLFDRIKARDRFLASPNIGGLKGVAGERLQ
jgi:hypothetical protein